MQLSCNTCLIVLQMYLYSAKIFFATNDNTHDIYRQIKDFDYIGKKIY